MAHCTLCHAASREISGTLGVCLRCLRERSDEALPYAMTVHRDSRTAFQLPEAPPQASDGVRCTVCMHQCRVPEGQSGYCGLRRNEGGRLTGVTARQGKLSWYHDPLPTNCVADWVCPGGTGCGYPRFAYRSHAEYGYSNLAVFFAGCTFNCLYCQNWQFKEQMRAPGFRTGEQLAAAVDERTACICYFGGDPSPQLPFSLRASRLARERKNGHVLRICWETNGSMHPVLLDQMVDLALESGGCIKFDLKAWDENVHLALSGVANQRTKENFARAGAQLGQRPSPPLLVASTLLVPGYIDEKEIRQIARFIAGVNPDIPYALLAFYPHFFLSDLPHTPRSHAEQYLAIARDEGLNNVRLGNVHLLG